MKKLILVLPLILVLVGAAAIIAQDTSSPVPVNVRLNELSNRLAMAEARLALAPLMATSNIVIGTNMLRGPSAHAIARPKRKFITPMSKFVAAECQFCDQTNIVSTSCTIMQTIAKEDGTIEAHWVITFNCPHCKTQFNDQRVSILPKPTTAQIE